MAKYKRPTIEVSCEWCKTLFQKEKRLITKTIERSGVHCCTKKCSYSYISAKAKLKCNPFNHYLINMRKSSARKNTTLSVTAQHLSEVWEAQDGKCALTGLTLVHAEQRKEKSLYQASVDRLDNAKGYEIGNVQFTTLGANYMRNTFSVEEVSQYISKLRI